ncbi:hypothetical protein FD15_GL001282 [Liquorilactobacillus sucicola DSM 21376 = JCM 15457]|uniref:Ion transport domain-containing protein n=1 Tax=Liquorilactobacillus sucicola DSM 21376 = JCM 15457 TaxID=1423806 RepID=A0A0R2DZL1_9LACO|nr:hypothetical protein FD15_GL001282 [Liquorilactobacillus sucicola DSM 21376 = JCM 15457]
MFRTDKFEKIYDVIIIFLTVTSIVLVILDYANILQLSSPPYIYIDNSILLLFTVDFFSRLALAKSKNEFLKNNL